MEEVDGRWSMVDGRWSMVNSTASTKILDSQSEKNIVIMIRIMIVMGSNYIIIPNHNPYHNKLLQT